MLTASTALAGGLFRCRQHPAYGYPEHWIKSLGKRLKRCIKGLTASTLDQSPQGTVNWSVVMAALRAVGYNDGLRPNCG